MTIRQKTAYKVDLKAYMAECEANFIRLLKLLPKNSDEMHYEVEYGEHCFVDVDIYVRERCKYTTMISIEQRSAVEHLPNLHFTCRIYYDANMVEVMTFQQQQASYASYVYPNVQMLQSDEKYQQQRFLSECLRHCLNKGYSSNYDLTGF